MRRTVTNNVSQDKSVPTVVNAVQQQGWTVSGITCEVVQQSNVSTDDPDQQFGPSNPSINVANGRASVQTGWQSSGSFLRSYRCTYEVTKLASPKGTLQLVKKTLGGDGTFGFTSAALSNPSLTTVSGTAQTAATSVNAGAYTLTEAPATGWDLSSIACTGNAASATVNLASRNVSVPVAANEAVICTFTNTDVKRRTEAIIHNFMARRAERVTANGPAVDRLIDRLSDPEEAPEHREASLKDDPPSPMKLGGRSEAAGAGAASPSDRPSEDTPRGHNIGVTAGGEGGEERGRFAFAGSLGAAVKAAAQHDAEKMRLGGIDGGRTRTRAPVLDMWVEGAFDWSSYERGQSTASFSLIKLGIDYKLAPGLLVGVMAQHDSMEEKSAALGYLVRGQGWMAGPYAAARLSKNLFLDGRLLYGSSSNEISPFLTYTDHFSTTRWLAAARLSGRWAAGNWRFTPSAEIVHYEDKSRAYTDSNGFGIDSQQVKLGRVIFGPEVAYTFQHGGTSLIPHVTVKGLWDFEKPVQFVVGVPGAKLATSDLHARIEAGFTLKSQSGISLGVTGAYEGLGGDGQETKWVKGTVKLPLQ